MRNHQHALATLREVTVRAGESQRSGAAVLPGPTGAAGQGDAPRPVAAARPSSAVARHDSGLSPLVFSDEDADSAVDQLRLPFAPLGRERRGLRGYSIVGFMVTVVLAVTAVLALTTSGSPGKPRHAAQGAARAHHHPVVRARAATTTTTVPSLPATLVPGTSSTSGSAVYTVALARYTVSLASGSSPCWVYAKQVSSGHVLWTGTMQPGATRTLNARGSVEVELGYAPGMSVRVNGHPVQFAATTLYLTFMSPTTS